MRILTLLLLSGLAWGQTVNTPEVTPQTNPAPKLKISELAPPPNEQHEPITVIIPAGAKIPLSLQQAISTKNARGG